MSYCYTKKIECPDISCSECNIQTRKDFIVVQDERGYYRLLKFNEINNSYSDIIDMIKKNSKAEAREFFADMHNIDINDIYQRA